MVTHTFTQFTQVAACLDDSTPLVAMRSELCPGRPWYAQASDATKEGPGGSNTSVTGTAVEGEENGATVATVGTQDETNGATEEEKKDTAVVTVATGAGAGVAVSEEASESSVSGGDVPIVEDVPNTTVSTRTIALNFYLPSSRVDNFFWDATTDGFQLMSNGTFLHQTYTHMHSERSNVT